MPAFSWSAFPRHVIYVCIWKDRLRVKNISTGKVFDDVPFISYANAGRRGLFNARPTVGATGSAAKALLPDAINPFGHPRSIIHQWGEALDLLDVAVKSVLPSFPLFKPGFVMCIHVMEELEGGLTQPEGRSLMELGVSLGAKHVHLVTDSPLLGDREFLRGGRLAQLVGR